MQIPEKIWIFDPKLGDKFVPLPHLGYITEINLYNYENEFITAADFWIYLFRFTDDIKDPQIPCWEKKIALKTLWENIGEFLNKNGDYIWIFPARKGEKYWWWRP